tara:strand:- start:267 stop:842 length:576 start_codon:yes stop_codon:yes gene_type:complete
MQKIKVSKLKPNKENPRAINKSKFQRLKKSIQEFPKMLEIRPIVVDEDFIVLGGNMRLQALKELGVTETYYIQEKNLTPEQKKQFIIKDNTSFGDWDWDILANQWETSELKDWGLDVWQPEESVSNEKDYSINSLDEKLDRFLDAKIKNITIPFETEEFSTVVEKLEILLDKYNCKDYRALIYKIIENEKI